MDLVERARIELSLLNEDPALIKAIIKVVETFQDQDFDGLAQGFAVGYLHLLFQAKPLTVLTDAPNGWEKFHKRKEDEPIWLSRRDPDALSTDGGKTFWLKSDAKICDPDPSPVYTSAPHDQVMFPQTYRDAVGLTGKSFSDQPDPV